MESLKKFLGSINIEIAVNPTIILLGFINWKKNVFKKVTGLGSIFFSECPAYDSLYAIYKRYIDPEILIIVWIISNLWKTATDPNCNKIISIVQPVTTPNIVGIAFLKPKLNAV